MSALYIGTYVWMSTRSGDKSNFRHSVHSAGIPADDKPNSNLLLSIISSFICFFSGGVGIPVVLCPVQKWTSPKKLELVLFNFVLLNLFYLIEFYFYVYVRFLFLFISRFVTIIYVNSSRIYIIGAVSRSLLFYIIRGLDIFENAMTGFVKFD